MDEHVKLYHFHRHVWLTETYVMSWSDYVELFKHEVK